MFLSCNRQPRGLEDGLLRRGVRNKKLFFSFLSKMVFGVCDKHCLRERGWTRDRSIWLSWKKENGERVIAVIKWDNFLPPIHFSFCWKCQDIFCPSNFQWKISNLIVDKLNFFFCKWSSNFVGDVNNWQCWP